MLSVALEPRGHDHFADLALVGHVLADQQVFHDLLRDGGAALRPARIGEIADKGADDAALVDAVMLEEAPILGGDERLLHQVGNVGERHPDPAIAAARTRWRNCRPCRRAPRSCSGSLRPLSRVGSGRSAAALLKNSITWPRSTTGLVDVLVLAELMIGGVQVGEIDAVKGLDVGAEGFRIGQARSR